MAACRSAHTAVCSPASLPSSLEPAILANPEATLLQGKLRTLLQGAYGCLQICPCGRLLACWLACRRPSRLCGLLSRCAAWHASLPSAYDAACRLLQRRAGPDPQSLLFAAALTALAAGVCRQGCYFAAC